MDFAALYRELENSTEIIRSLLAGITQEAAQVKPDAESWSILEVICHLYDEECEDFREHVYYILHRQNEEWHQIDPQAWVSERKYNEQVFDKMKEKFFSERRKSLAWLTEMSNANWETNYTSQYGSTSAGEMFACWVAHDNLHTRQLVELRRLFIERITRTYDLEYAGDW